MRLMDLEQLHLRIVELRLLHLEVWCRILIIILILSGTISLIYDILHAGIDASLQTVLRLDFGIHYSNLRLTVWFLTLHLSYLDSYTLESLLFLFNFFLEILVCLVLDNILLNGYFQIRRLLNHSLLILNNSRHLTIIWCYLIFLFVYEWGLKLVVKCCLEGLSLI